MSLILNRSSHFSSPSGPVCLLILDGAGLGQANDANAFYMAKTPVLDGLFQGPFFCALKAHGKAVGMPTDLDMGNSEVGHNTLGAGRVFDQGASLVRQAIDSKTIFKSDCYRKAVSQVNSTANTLHTIGLLSDGNVHSHIDHLIAMTQQAVHDGVQAIRCHILLDGRDVHYQSALGYVDRLEAHLSTLRDLGCDALIASGGGRMVTTMDRYNADWSIVERGWQAHVLGTAPAFKSAADAIQSGYDSDPDISDQYLPAFTICNEDGPVGPIHDGDSVLMLNFRGDRAIELSQAFESKSFSHFDRVRVPNVFYAGMMQYDGDTQCPKHFLVPPPAISHPIGEYFCASGLKTLAVSETQKYGHVTYFFNGNKSGYFDRNLETYHEIQSDKIPFDQAPKMKAKEITDYVLDVSQKKQFDFIRINFPNGDMVGHTGNFDAAIAAMEAVDLQTGRLVDGIRKLGGRTVVLADHGNCDVMFTQKNGQRIPHTAHTLAPVPFVIDHLDSGYCLIDIDTPGLGNVASTLCQLLGFEPPADYWPGLLKSV